MKKKSVGVIVGRFQTPSIKQGYRDLVKYVQARHSEVVIVLGISRTKGSKKDPLDFETRAPMVAEEFPRVHIRSITDEANDKVWSAKLDALIKKDWGSAILYGGRDSFIPRYNGTLDTHQIPSFGKKGVTSTLLREEAGKYTLNHENFRRGVIYSTQNQFPRTFMTVDMAITRPNSGGKTFRVLLGRKHMKDALRFPGGFVDPTDDNLEYAAKRELSEEAPGISVEGDMKYLGSYLIDDWRYQDEDKIMTAFFHGEYTFGNTEAGDDLVFVGWFPLTQRTRQQVWENHRGLFDKLCEHMQQREKTA